MDERYRLTKLAEQGDSSALLGLIALATKEEDDELWQYCELLIGLLVETLESELHTLQHARKQITSMREQKRLREESHKVLEAEEQERLRKESEQLREADSRQCQQCGDQKTEVNMYTGERALLCYQCEMRDGGFGVFRATRLDMRRRSSLPSMPKKNPPRPASRPCPKCTRNLIYGHTSHASGMGAVWWCLHCQQAFPEPKRP